MSDRSDLTDWANRQPGSPFVVTPDGAHSYGRVEELVARRAATLGDLAGEQLAVRPRLDVDSIVEILAAGRAGATAVLVDPGRPDADDLTGMARVDPRSCHTILFTSGSRGRPQGVRFSADNWRAAAEASMNTLGHGPGDRWLCPLPLHHVGGLSIVFRSLRAGGCVVLSPTPDHTAAWLDRVRFASLVPTQLRRALDTRTDSYRQHARVLVGGGPADEVLLDRATTAGLEVLPSYGMTETTAQAATARPGDPLRRLVALPGVEVDIGADDRIRVRGRTVSLSYLGAPDRRPGDWFVTADRGRLEADGSLTVTGRADRTVISGGENIDPEAVEEVVATAAGVEEVAVIGIPDPDWGEVVAAAYRGWGRPEDLAALVRRTLGPRAVPKRWLQVDRLPRTPLGKIDQTALSSLFESGAG